MRQPDQQGNELKMIEAIQKVKDSNRTQLNPDGHSTLMLDLRELSKYKLIEILDYL